MLYNHQRVSLGINFNLLDESIYFIDGKIRERSEFDVLVLWVYIFRWMILIFYWRWPNIGQMSLSGLKLIRLLQILCNY